jgi:hypothetical protein
MEQTAIWRAEKIRFDAAYDHQRVPAWLYLPKSANPPYQTIVYVPPRSARYLARIDEYDVKFTEFLVKSGRAVVFTVCQGIYEGASRILQGRAAKETGSSSSARTCGGRSIIRARAPISRTPVSAITESATERVWA